MMKLVPETDPILTIPTDIFDMSKPSTDPRLLAKEMFETMRRNDGIGLAAPQVGLSCRVFVMLLFDLSDLSEQLKYIMPDKFSMTKEPVACFNPKIIKSSEQVSKGDEGCLSFPNLYLKVDRPTWIEATWQDEHGEVRETTLYGIEARCFQHELDHLNGLTFISKVGRTSLAMARSKRKLLSRRSK